jgi:hypothetical protein
VHRHRFFTNRRIQNFPRICAHTHAPAHTNFCCLVLLHSALTRAASSSS